MLHPNFVTSYRMILIAVVFHKLVLFHFSEFLYRLSCYIDFEFIKSYITVNICTYLAFAFAIGCLLFAHISSFINLVIVSTFSIVYKAALMIILEADWILTIISFVLRC